MRDSNYLKKHLCTYLHICPLFIIYIYAAGAGVTSTKGRAVANVVSWGPKYERHRVYSDMHCDPIMMMMIGCGHHKTYHYALCIIISLKTIC